MKGELVPLYGFVRGDTLGLLVLVYEKDTIAQVAETLAQAAGVRVAPFDDRAIRWKGTVLDPTKTVTAVGLSALERIDLVGVAGDV
jgi:hypothetical protein